MLVTIFPIAVMCCNLIHTLDIKIMMKQSFKKNFTHNAYDVEQKAIKNVFLNV